MCGTMCCQTPPYATIKAFSNSTWNLSWADDKSDPGVGAERSIRQATIFGGIQATGCKHPNTVGTAEDDGTLLERNTSGTDVRESSSGFYGISESWIAQDPAVTETWVLGYNTTGSSAKPKGFYYTSAGGPAPYSLSATTGDVLPDATWGPSKVMSSSLLVGRPWGTLNVNTPQTRTIATKWSSSGAESARLLNSGLSKSGNIVVVGQAQMMANNANAFAISVVEGASHSFLFRGIEHNQVFSRPRLWLMNSNLSEVAAATIGPEQGYPLFHGLHASNWRGNTSNSAGSVVYLTAVHGPSGPASGTTAALWAVSIPGVSMTKVVDLGDWPESFQILAVGSSVFIAANRDGDLSVMSISGAGVTNWEVSVPSLPDRGRVLSSGLAVFGGNFSGVRILDVTTGATVANIDNNKIHDVAEIGTSVYCVGPKRERHE